MPQVMVLSSEGYFYSYNIDLENGGECSLMKQYRYVLNGTFPTLRLFSHNQSSLYAACSTRTTRQMIERARDRAMGVTSHIAVLVLPSSPYLLVAAAACPCAPVPPSPSGLRPISPVAVFCFHHLISWVRTVFTLMLRCYDLHDTVAPTIRVIIQYDAYSGCCPFDLRSPMILLDKDKSIHSLRCDEGMGEW